VSTCARPPPGVQVELGANEICQMYQVNACNEFVYLPYGAPLDAAERAQVSSAQQLEEWFWSLQRVQFHLTNTQGEPFTVYWEDPEREPEEREQLVASLGPVINTARMEGVTTRCSAAHRRGWIVTGANRSLLIREAFGDLLGWLTCAAGGLLGRGRPSF
jgi:hypothetical protein